MRIVKCDMCGTEITRIGHVGKIRLMTLDGSKTVTPYQHDVLDAIDLCDDCLQSIYERVTKTAEVAEPEEHPKGSSRIKLDIDKIRALRAAGWSISAIADEMRVSYGTISNRLKEVGVT